MSRLQEQFKSEHVKALMAKLSLRNVMEVPRITKITVNMGVGEAVGDKKTLEHATADMTKITGQKPQVTVARKSVARLQDPRWLPDRLQSHAASRAHV